MKKMLKEDRIIGTENLPNFLWANGTTTHRFNFNDKDKTGHFVDPQNPQNKAQVNAATPLFLTTDVDLMLNYANEHLNGDRKDPNATSVEGISVFAKLHHGVDLFDFTDPDDFAVVFENKIDRPEEIARIFDGCEPYFSFNTSISNSGRGFEPMEFKIARYMSIYYNAPANSRVKANGELRKGFFDPSFIGLFADANDSTFDHIFTKDDYDDMRELYNDIMELKGAYYSTSRTGRDQLRLPNGDIGIIFPDTLTNDQISLVNCYLRLLKYCVKEKDVIKSTNPEVFEYLRDNANSQKRIGFSDLLQTCLWTAIASSGYFQGFYCPEFKGIESRGLKTHGTTIGLFTLDAIEEMMAYTLQQVNYAIHQCSTPKETLDLLLNGIKTYQGKYDRDQQKQLAKERARIRAEKDKKEFDIRTTNNITEYRINDFYIDKVLKYVDNDVDFSHYWIFNTSWRDACKKWLNELKNRWAKYAPEQQYKHLKAEHTKREIEYIKQKVEKMPYDILKSTAHKDETLQNRISHLGIQPKIMGITGRKQSYNDYVAYLNRTRPYNYMAAHQLRRDF